MVRAAELKNLRAGSIVYLCDPNADKGAGSVRPIGVERMVYNEAGDLIAVEFVNIHMPYAGIVYIALAEETAHELHYTHWQAYNALRFHMAKRAHHMKALMAYNEQRMAEVTKECHDHKAAHKDYIEKRDKNATKS